MMHTRTGPTRLLLLLALAVLGMLSGCGVLEMFSPPDGAETSTSTETVGDAARGEALFSFISDGVVACSTCHTIEESLLFNPSRTSGPALNGIAERAAERIPGMSAEDYLRQSIVDPHSYVVEGYDDLMFADYGRFLDEQELADLIAYLLTL